MTTITLTAHAEKLAPPEMVPSYQGKHPLLYHQARTYAALEQAPLVMNTYPTGTGKTVAALMRLLHPDQRGNSTLLIAPTNALIMQHQADTETFVQQNDLGLRVFPVDAQRIGQMMPPLRRGEVMHRLLENHLTFAEQLGLPDDAYKQPMVVVTNPDIFYLALFFQYHRNDQRNLFMDFIRSFRYIIIDEFHYYDNKQFANFLFFFALWQQWGYFAHGHKICLLSATPRSQVYTLLDRLFPSAGWQRIGPDNEPAESSAYATTRTLTELHLTIAAGQIEDWAGKNQGLVEHWHKNHLDSAIISSSLARINQLYDQLRHLDPARITGPEDDIERQRVRPLILATPTVDIGYNFGRPGKQRQSIDRLVCDARFSDELVQRIGRAGRVLGRRETDHRSEAMVIVGEDAAAALRPYDGQTLTRAEWASVMQELAAVLPPRHQLAGYIQNHAIKESFYPIYQIHKLTPDQEATLQELFDMVRDLFAPTTRQKAGGLKYFFNTYEQRRKWLGLKETLRWQPQNERDRRDLASHLAAYLSYMQSVRGASTEVRAEQVLPSLDQVLAQPSVRQQVQAFIEQQVAITKALFSFREAWQGPRAVVYDEQRLFSSQPINHYDLLHLVANYDLYVYESRAAFERAHGPVSDSVRDAGLYTAIRGFRHPRWMLAFEYDAGEWPKKEFEARFCHRVTALRGLRLRCREQGSSGAWQPVDTRIATTMSEEWVSCLIVMEESLGALLRVLRASPFVKRELLVGFPCGTERSYSIVTGTAAFHIEAELRGTFARLDRQQITDAIIC
jgi:CRISPR-associated endonuclease/helicase Cas3